MPRFYRLEEAEATLRDVETALRKAITLKAEMESSSNEFDRIKRGRPDGVDIDFFWHFDVIGEPRVPGKHRAPVASSQPATIAAGLRCRPPDHTRGRP